MIKNLIKAKFVVVHRTLLLEHLLFDGAQQIAGRLIQQLGFTLSTFCSGNSHATHNRMKSRRIQS